MTRRLAEVAKYVGVSEATVSRVLNGKPGISEATRTAVLTALDVLGYERPAKLRGERARLVGLVLPELQNPIFPAFAEVVAGTLARRGFTPVLCTRTGAGVSEADYVDMLLDQQVSGVIFAGGNYAQAAAEHEHYHRLRERGLPVVLVNAAIDDLGFACVALVRRGITGIICASDVLALGAMKAVRRLGLSVPGDVSVVGFDDSAFMNCTDPPLTTIRQPIDAMGQAAVALLANQVAGHVVPTEEMLFEPELVVRGSTGPVRTDESRDQRGSRSARASVRSRA